MRIVRRLMIVIVCVGLLGMMCVLLFPSVRLVIVMGLIGFGDPSWSPIADSNGLVEDCGLLIAGVPIDSNRKGVLLPSRDTSRVPHGRWSTRIRELHPTQVRVDHVIL